MSLDKLGAEGIRAAVRRLMAAVARPDVNVTVRRRDLEILMLSRVTIGTPDPTVARPSLHPAQQ